MLHTFGLAYSSSLVQIITAIIFFGVGIGTSKYNRCLSSPNNSLILSSSRPPAAYKGKIAATVTFAVSVLVAWVPEGLREFGNS
jgi:hypothetical protein